MSTLGDEERSSRLPQPRVLHQRDYDDAGPSTSRPPQFLTLEQRADQKIKDAELSKAAVFPPSGKFPCFSNSQFMNTAMMDEDYITVGSHIDDVTINKIKKGEYIDFGKLIPRDRILIEEENKL